MQILSQTDVHDILTGCAILGTGGGGSLEKGLELVDLAFAQGKQFKLVSFDEAPEDAWVAVPYNCGSVSPDTPEELAKYEGLPRVEESTPFLAYKALEQYLGVTFYGVMSTELGGGNTAQALYAGAMMDRMILDADPAGRSVPELQHSTFYIQGLPIYPLACANPFGEVAILPKVVNDERAELLVRAMAVVSKNTMGVADHPAQVKTLRGAVIHGAISHAWKIGRAYRQARQAGQDAAPQVAEVGGGKVLFRGTITRFHYDTLDGFTVGEVEIEGQEADRGHSYRVWFKNEHIFSWRDGAIDVTVPDLICLFDQGANAPLINPFLKEGTAVTVIGLPAPQEWRTPRGLEIFGPRHFGLEIDYQPLDERA